jgi:hypothetical protein
MRETDALCDASIAFGLFASLMFHCIAFELVVLAPFATTTQAVLEPNIVWITRRRWMDRKLGRKNLKDMLTKGTCSLHRRHCKSDDDMMMWWEPARPHARRDLVALRKATVITRIAPKTWIAQSTPFVRGVSDDHDLLYWPWHTAEKGLRLLHIITLWAALVTTMTYCWEGVLTLFIRLYNVLRIIWFRCNPGKIVHWLLLVLYPIVGLRAIDCCLDYCSLWTSQCGCRRRRSCLSFRPSSWLHSSTTLSSERPRWTSLTGFQDD